MKINIFVRICVIGLLAFNSIFSYPYQKKFVGVIDKITKKNGYYKSGKARNSCDKIIVYAIKLNEFNETVDHCKFTKKYKNSDDANRYVKRKERQQAENRPVHWRKNKNNKHDCSNSRYKNQVKR